MSRENHTTLELCTHCYKMALSIGTMLPVRFVYQDGTRETKWPLAIAGAEFTKDHDACECCAAQLRMIRALHVRWKAEDPGVPDEFLRESEVCCCERRQIPS